MGRRQMGWLARWTLVAMVGRRRWYRTGRRHMAVLRRLRLRFLCPVGTRLWVGKRLRLSVWRLRLLVTPYRLGARFQAPQLRHSRRWSGGRRIHHRGGPFVGEWEFPSYSRKLTCTLAG